MKPRVYVIFLTLIVPIQASLVNLLSLGSIRPDAGLATLYCIGLLAGPGEAVLAGMALGIVQDLGAAGPIGLTGLSRGLIGLLSGILGKHMLDFASPSIVLFITALSIVEGLFVALFLQIFYGSVPLFGLLFTRVLPTALYTGIFGFFLLRIATSKKALPALKRRPLQKERLS